MRECIKCDGKGIIPMYKHINNGICYDCDGRGFLFDTPEEEAEYEDVQEEIRLQNEYEAEGYQDYDEHEYGDAYSRYTGK